MKTIVKELEKITRKGYGFSNVFTDWLGLSVAAFCKDETTYMSIMNRYSNTGEMGEREADYFASALGALTLEMQKDCKDYLGDIFQEYVTRGENGQFFTPENICSMMAELTVHKSQERLSVADPACGSGRTLIETFKRLPNGIFVGTDLDARCVKMAALNFLFRNMDSYAINANTLTLEVYGGYKITRSVLGASITELSINEAARFLTIMKETIKKPANDNKDICQLALFG